jgi:hypothetical protein
VRYHEANSYKKEIDIVAFLKKKMSQGCHFGRLSGKSIPKDIRCMSLTVRQGTTTPPGEQPRPDAKQP